MKKYFYHAIAKKNLLGVAKEGFKINKPPNFKDLDLIEFGKNKIFFTSFIDDAESYGTFGAWRRERYPHVIIRIFYEENDLIKDDRQYVVPRRKNNYDYYSTVPIKTDMQINLIGATDIDAIGEKRKKRIWYNLTPELALKFKNSMKLKDLIQNR